MPRWIEYSCFYDVGGPFDGVLIMRRRALLFGVYSRASGFLVGSVLHSTVP